MDSPFPQDSQDQSITNGAVNMNWAFEQSPDCIKIMELDGGLLAMNRNGQCAMEVDDFTKLSGHKWPVLWPDVSRPKVHMAMERALAGEEGHFDAFCPTVKGTPKWWDVLVTPIRNSEGRVERLLAVSRDISEVRRVVEAQLELAARLQFTLDATEIGEWALDLETLAVTRTLRHDRCFGYPDGASEWSVDIMLAHLHPDDREHVRTKCQATLRSDTPLRYEARVIWQDQSIHWISVHGSRYRADNRPDRLIGIVSDITDRMRTTEELKDANQRKDEFLAMLAHELRNPLAPISAAAQILTLGRADAALTLKAGTIIDRQARHMNRLLDDLLDVSRVTQGLVTLSMTRLDLKRVIADAVEQARPLIEQNQHQFSVQLDPAQAFALGDDKRLVQVLVNLLNNSAKYTPRGGSIALRLRCEGDAASISVKDDGVGMDAATLDNAFELFSQAVRSSDRSAGGLGLGLALVKSLVERHDGSVAGHSAGKGTGSEFIVTLPLLAAARAPEDSAASQAPAAGARLRLLIVDDNRDAAETLGMVLGAEGHEIHLAFAGQEALDSAATIRPDACLLDVGLPDMSGYELARRLHALPEACEASMIAVTGYGSKNDREHSAHAGIDHHLTKPVDTALLNEVLAAIAPKAMS